jgi:phenylacetate-CoA ligase
VLISTDGIQQQYYARAGERSEFRARIRVNPWMPREKLRAWQLRTLNRLMRQAKRDVPFYAERLPSEPFEHLSDLEQLPLLTRDEVVAAGAMLHSSMYSPTEVIPLRTGGTTGSSMYLRCPPASLARHYEHFARFREWIGIPDGARVAAFGGRAIAGADTPHWRTDANGALLCCADGIDGASLESCVSALREFNPEVLDGYPSAIEPLARYIKSRGIRDIRPLAVITSGDPLTAGARRLIEDAFGCPVFDHYGSAEMVASISQCRAGSYHINGDYGIVEIRVNGREAEPGEAGEIVATGFLNDAMPLIRYATGDIAIRGTTHCACGRTFSTVERIVGRGDESVVAPDGQVIARLDALVRGASSVLEARVIQDAPDHVIVEAVAAGIIDPMEAATLLSELRNRLGPSVRADLVRVDRIPRSTGGRFRAVQWLNPSTPVRAMPKVALV